jgi:drug/metabolite transporter (DMT)-like permease
MNRRQPNPAQWLNFDALGVLVFVLVGRNNHAEETQITGTLRTAAPFLIAMLVGWYLSKAWRAPETWRTGLITWACTVVLGLVLRRLVWGNGIATAFIIVATVFLAMTMFSWRLVLQSIHRRTGGGSGSDD